MTRFAVLAWVATSLPGTPRRRRTRQKSMETHRSDPKAHNQPEAFVAHSSELIRQSAGRRACWQVNTEGQQGHGNRKDPVAQSGQALNFQARIRLIHKVAAIRPSSTDTDNLPRHLNLPVSTLPALRLLPKEGKLNERAAWKPFRWKVCEP